MASFLSYVYNRQSSAPARFHSSQTGGEDQEQATQFLHPVVSSSGSSETAWGPHLSHDDDENSFVHTVATRSEDVEPMTSPFTPEGLLPRKSPDSLRRELNVPPRVLDNTLKRTQKKERFSGVAKLLASNDNPHYKNTVRSDHFDMILPPSKYLQNKPSFESSIQSPPVSTSSFYSRSTCPEDRVAMSPVLQVGQARTAVGAIVALREAANQNHNTALRSRSRTTLLTATSKQEVQKQNAQDESFTMGVLPPRTNFHDYDNDNEDDITTEVASEDENVPYLPLGNTTALATLDRRQRSNSGDDDSTLHASPSSLRWPKSHYPRRRVTFGRGMIQAENNEQDSSFCSRAEMIIQNDHILDRMQQLDPSNDGYDFQPIILPSSSSSSIGIIRERVHEDESDTQASEDINEGSQPEETVDQFYNFNENAFDEVLMTRKFRNQQRQNQLKQMAANDEEKEEEKVDDFEAEERFSDDDSDGERDDLEDIEDKDVIGVIHATNDVAVDTAVPLSGREIQGCADFDDALLRRKTRNQRQEKESLLIEVVARLRDNLDLVADVEAATSNSVATMGSWFVRTPKDSGNLLAGFTSQQRNKLLDSIDSIVKEIQVAQPEEFFMSPSQIPFMAMKHDTLHQALNFCRALIFSAVPRAEKEKLAKGLRFKHENIEQHLFLWKCLPELRTALGIMPPESPDTLRGGATSLFSLPEESGADTPYTSNVSMATSITSVNPRSCTTRPQLILQQDGLQLRHSIAVLSSLLQKLSLACSKLAELNADQPSDGKASTSRFYVFACEEIKRNYLQLLAINKGDSRALMEAFHLDLVSPQTSISLTREVSADEEDEVVPRYELQETSSTSRRMPPPIPEEIHQRRIQNPFDETSVAQPLPHRAAGDIHNESNLFSPSTEDMRSLPDIRNSKNAVPFEYDDLRRQLGSFEREDGLDEQRDEAPRDDFESREGSIEWKKMYQNVSLAASSIRSVEQTSKK